VGVESLPATWGRIVRTRNFLLLAIVAATVAAMAGDWAARHNSEEPHKPPQSATIDGLEIDLSHLDFGEVWASEDWSRPFPVRNTTDHTIHIEEFRTGCHCHPADPKTLTIPPGETREVRLILDPAKQSPALVGQPYRVDTEIRPVIHGKPAARAWRVRGTIRPLIETDTPAVLFGESNRVGQPPVARRVRVQFRDPGEAVAELAPAVAGVKVMAGGSPTEWTVVVTPHTDRKPGPFRGTLTITNLPTDVGTQIVSVALPVEGVLVEADQ
jgi:hypothetical protein